LKLAVRLDNAVVDRAKSTPNPPLAAGLRSSSIPAIKRESSEPVSPKHDFPPQSPSSAPPPTDKHSTKPIPKVEDDEVEVLVPITKSFTFKKMNISEVSMDEKKDDNAGVAPVRKLTNTPLVPMDSESGQSSTPSDANQTKKGTLRQKMIEQALARNSGAGAALSSAHNRTMSIPALNEREMLIKEHKFHLAVMGESFQKEMDLYEGVVKGGDSNYVDEMINLLTKLSQSTIVLRNRFQDYKRRLDNLEKVDDDFLDQMDAFKKLG